jgi:hypothetical protein
VLLHLQVLFLRGRFPDAKEECRDNCAGDPVIRAVGFVGWLGCRALWPIPTQKQLRNTTRAQGTNDRSTPDPLPPDSKKGRCAVRTRNRFFDSDRAEDIRARGRVG